MDPRIPGRIEGWRRLGAKAAAHVAWAGPLLVRLSLGVVFVESGWGKLHSLPDVTEFFASLGIPAPAANAVLASTTELACGALVLAGLATRLAALPLAFVMAVAIATAKLPEASGVTDVLAFEEFTYLAACVWLAVAGPGAASLDHLVGRWWRARAAAPPLAASSSVRA